jgi:hypothetical protein
MGIRHPDKSLTGENTMIEAIKKANHLFCRAANAWVAANNSGDSEIYNTLDAKCDALRERAEALLRPHGITVSYPGLYPMWKYNGREYFGMESLINTIELEG